MSDAETVQRWETLGGSWRLIARGPAGLTIALCRCDGGEEAQRLTSSEPELLALIGDRASSEDAPC